MSDLKQHLIKLGADHRDLRKHIRPILAELEAVASEEDLPYGLPWKLDSSGNPRPLQKLRAGRLGEVSYWQAKAHEDAGVSTHQWGFHKTMGSKQIEICRVCNLKRTKKR